MTIFFFAVPDDVITKALGNFYFNPPLLVYGFNIYNNIQDVGELILSRRRVQVKIPLNNLQGSFHQTSELF